MSSPTVSPEQLASFMSSARIFDARAGAGAADAYAASHLAGAVRADPNRDLAAHGDPAHGGRHPLPPLDVFLRTLGKWGVTPATDIVVYDDQRGANAAARLWWMLRAVGHERVAVLDGGWQAALEAGLETTSALPTIAPAPAYPAAAWALPIATIDDVDARRSDSSWRILDVRAPFRYRGDSDPFDPNPGHIPGALSAPYERNLDPNGRFKDAATLRSMYAPLLPNEGAQHVVVQCGSGITACHTLLALDIAGLPGASLYVGSWSEWCRSNRPRAQGDEP